jgi:hypothetical protein
MYLFIYFFCWLSIHSNMELELIFYKKDSKRGQTIINSNRNIKITLSYLVRYDISLFSKKNNNNNNVQVLLFYKKKWILNQCFLFISPI